MIREDVIAYAKEQYGVVPDHPWRGDPDSEVLRHTDTRKWFGLLMYVGRKNLGLTGDDKTDILNVKCDPVLAGSLRSRGILPAYHMNHTEWITILLDGSIEKEQVFSLLDLSFDLTASPRKKRERRGPAEWLIPANPKYFDVPAAFRKNPVIGWKQSSSIREGDIVYMYMGAPVSAILYECRVVEADIPCRYEDENITMRKRMKIRKLREFDPARFTLEVLRSHGVYGVRGPRGVPAGLLEELQNA